MIRFVVKDDTDNKSQTLSLERKVEISADVDHKLLNNPYQ